jgi:hypothetical protein
VKVTVGDGVTVGVGVCVGVSVGTATTIGGLVGVAVGVGVDTRGTEVMVAVGNAVEVGDGASVAVGDGVAVGGTGVGEGVAVGVGTGVGVGVSVGAASRLGTAVAATGGTLIVRANMLRLSTWAVATDLEKSTAVASWSHSTLASTKCWMTMLDSTPPAIASSWALRRTVMVTGFVRTTGPAAGCAGTVKDRSKTVRETAKPAGSGGASSGAIFS